MKHAAAKQHATAELSAAEQPATAKPAAPKIIRVSAVVMQDSSGRVLNVRKRGTSMFMLPGGKPEAGEDAATCALREFSEEIGITLDPARLAPLGVFQAAAANEPNHIVEAAVFTHPFVAGADEAAPLAEIEHVEWVDPTIERADMAPLNTELIFPVLRSMTPDSLAAEMTGDLSSPQQQPH